MDVDSWWLIVVLIVVAVAGLVGGCVEGRWWTNSDAVPDGHLYLTMVTTG